MSPALACPDLPGVKLLGRGRPAPEASDDSEALSSAETEQSRIDKLFAELKRERNEKAAERIAARIGEEWSHSGSASIDLMMGWSKTAMDGKKFDVALDFLDQVVTMQPNYAEGWNRRATVHFMMNNFAKSMADIHHTLELEPRHFGALSGIGQIMKASGQNELALEAWQRVLAIYPDAAQRPERGGDAVRGDGGREHLTGAACARVPGPLIRNRPAYPDRRSGLHLVRGAGRGDRRAIRADRKAQSAARRVRRDRWGDVALVHVQAPAGAGPAAAWYLFTARAPISTTRCSRCGPCSRAGRRCCSSTAPGHGWSGRGPEGHERRRAKRR